MIDAQAILVIALPLCTLLLAVRFAIPPARRGKQVRAKVLLRALFPSRIVRSRSGRMDCFFFVLGAFFFSALFGWSILSGAFVAHSAKPWLDWMLGARPMADVSPVTARLTMTAALFLAADFAYWLNHWMSHRFAVMWAFHKVHHSAESLSALTLYRVHPVDTIIYYNMKAICLGVTAAVVDYLFGRDVDIWTLGGVNALIFIGTWLLTHLQHSHLWISFPGPVGRLFMSPAHHQIHHSVDPRHHNRNLGGILSVWDRTFGTLWVPAKSREKLVFGIADYRCDPHSLKGAMLIPIVDAGNSLFNRSPQPASGEAATI